jgi:hypothetical protein
MSNKVTDIITKPINWLRKKQAGPAPSLDPKVILNELKNDKTIKKVKNNNEVFLLKDSAGNVQGQDKAVTLIQRGLIALGIMPFVDTTENYWWQKPILGEGFGGFAWGSYGDRTTDAIKTLQKLAKVDHEKGRDGWRFEADTLKALEVALKAKADGRDWKAAVQKASK